MFFQTILVTLLAAAALACNNPISLGGIGCNLGIAGGVLPTDLGISGVLGCGNLGVLGGVLPTDLSLTGGIGCGNLGVLGGVLPTDLSLTGGIGCGNLGGLLSSNFGGCGTLPSVCGPSLVAPEVVLPSPPSAPLPSVPSRVISNNCNCVKTIVRSQPVKQVVNVPTRRQFTQTFTRPTYQTVVYRAKGPTGPIASGIGDYAYPQIDLVGAAGCDNSLVSPLVPSCLPSLPSLPVC